MGNLLRITDESFKGWVGKTTTAPFISQHIWAKLPRRFSLMPTRTVPRPAGRNATNCLFPSLMKRTQNAPENSHTVIDTKADLNDEDLIFLDRDCVLLVLPATPDALGALGRTIERLHGVKRQHNLDRSVFYIFEACADKSHGFLPLKTLADWLS